MIPEFPHHPPKDYSYEYDQFNTRLISIWLRCHRHFDYNLGKPTRTIWGFYSPKHKQYYAPVNASKCGDKVNIEDTRNYTAMPIQKSVLESFFV